MIVILAIAYAVDTHAIWSSGVPKLARMSLSATLTIEMSRNAINPAVIAAIVISSLLPRRTVLSSISRSDVNGDVRTHAGPQCEVGRGVDPHEDGDALHDLDEVAGRVVGR